MEFQPQHTGEHCLGLGLPVAPDKRGNFTFPQRAFLSFFSIKNFPLPDNGFQAGMRCLRPALQCQTDTDKLRRRETFLGSGGPRPAAYSEGQGHASIT